MIHDNPSKTVYALLQYQLAPSKNAACFPAQKQHIMRRALCLGALATASGSSVFTQLINTFRWLVENPPAHELRLKMIGNPNEGYNDIMSSKRGPLGAQHSDHYPFLNW